MTMRPHRPSHPGTGMTVRLVALVLLPVMVMCAFAGTVVLSRRATAAQGVAVARGLNIVNRLVGLRDALQAQQALQAMTVRLAQLGVTPAVASQFLGVDLTAAVVKERAQAAEAVHALGTSSPLRAADLRALFRDIDSGAVVAAGTLARLNTYEDAVDAAVVHTLSGLDLAGRVTKIDDPVAALIAVIRAEELATDQGIDLSEVWFPTPGASQTTSARVFARLASSTAAYDATVADLRDLDVPRVAALLTAMDATPSVRAFGQAVAATLAGVRLRQPVTAASAVPIASVFRGFLARSAQLQEMVAVAAAEVGRDARKLADEGRRGFLLWGLGTAVLALASIAIALMLGRSISRPLKQLAAYAHAVNEGQLGGAPVLRSNHGPRETRLVFRAFEDLVASLRLLDAKANALADCDFDAPVLTAPLPGRLGQSLQSSVTVLSNSIMERDELQAHLSHQATHDSLTGVLNRAAGVAGLQAAMNRATRTGSATGVLFVDLVDFKAVNDRLGHHGGDEVLLQVASRMAQTLRGGDFVARFGGDEFVVVAESADVEELTLLARRLVDVVAEPMHIGEATILVGASIGIAISLDGPEDPARLIARADTAMYRAKAREGSAIEIFDATLQDSLVKNRDIELALTEALADPAGGGLRLDYQPIISTESQSLVGVEALIRWERPGHGPLTPDEFIPIAEASPLIILLDCWVLDRAVRQLAEWSRVAALADLTMSVNISGRHLLSRSLSGHLLTVLAHGDIDPGRLTVEITETVVLEDLIGAAAELEDVRRLGVRVAIDDFGTGHTSLAHLQQLPMDAIKIDRSFISQLDSKLGRALVEMVTVFGSSMGIPTVAEGVETPEELEVLTAMGADRVQGYLLARPLHATAVPTWAAQAALTRTSRSA
jgi:diguanylate cyclase (GGDEF)-like protein